MTELVAYERRQIESPRAISLKTRPIMPMDSHDETRPGRIARKSGRHSEPQA